MNQASLSMSALRRVRFRMEGLGKIWKSERHYRPGQPGAGMRPEPLVWLIHVAPQKQEECEMLQRLLSARYSTPGFRRQTA